MYRSKSPTGLYEKDSADRTVVGQGAGNLLCALFGGFGGCGLIPNTLLNASSGGVGYASGYAYALFTALAVVFCSPVLGAMPMAALAGLMLTVATNTFQWHETSTLLKSTFTSVQHGMDLLAMLVTTYLCFKVDMGLGVAAGVLLAKLPTIVNTIKSKVVGVQA